MLRDNAKRCYAATMEKKHKHIDLIQEVVNRMAQHSFILKGWGVTLVVAVFALNAKDGLDKNYLLAAIIPVVIFWFLDGYYLQKERLFRALFDEVRIKEEADIDYSMDIKHLRKGNLTLRAVLRSRTLIGLYLPLLLLIGITYKIG